MQKFKKGDVIEAIDKGRGFEQARVLGTFIEEGKKSRFKGREMYLLKIPCGTATIPIETGELYKLVDKQTYVRI